MNKIDVAGLKVDSITKEDFLKSALIRIKNGQKTFVITPYSEFLYHSFGNPELLDIFNQADFSLADGIGIFWAKKYLDLSLSAKSYWGKVLQAAWQLKYSLAAIIFYPKWIKAVLPEKIVGTDLVWDLARLSSENNLSIYLLGGFGDTPELAAKKLQTAGSKLKVAGWSNKNPSDPTIINDINKVSPDLLMVAFGPITQEKWIAENLSKLNIKLAIGVGGSFDYIAGKKSAPPKFVRYTGLEWLYRLITQPYRFKRILNATFGLAWRLWHYKIFSSLPFRPNVVSVILNSQKEILIVLRNPADKDLRDVGDFDAVKFKNYWQLPQGGTEPGESLEQGARREIFEELGMKNLNFLLCSEKTSSYSWKNGLRPFFNIYHYKGQQQHVLYFVFTGQNIEIKIDGQENIRYQWVKPELLDKAVHKERGHLAKIAQEDLKEMSEKGIN